MLKKFLALFLLTLLVIPSFAAIAGLESPQEKSIVKVGEDIIIPTGAEIKSAVAVGGNIIVGGKVLEDVVAIGGNVTLKDSASVGGDVVSVGGAIIKSDMAKIAGTVVEVKTPAGMITKGLGWGLALFSLLSFVAFLVLAVILIALFPKQIGITSYYTERLPGHALLWGVVAVLATPFAIILLILSVFGMPFIPILAIILAAAFVFGYVAVAQLVGKLALKAFRVRNKPMAIEAIVGLVLFFLVGFLPILGWILKSLAGLAGLGAVIATRFGTRD